MKFPGFVCVSTVIRNCSLKLEIRGSKQLKFSVFPTTRGLECQSLRQRHVNWRRCGVLKTRDTVGLPDTEVKAAPFGLWTLSEAARGAPCLQR